MKSTRMFAGIGLVELLLESIPYTSHALFFFFFGCVYSLAQKWKKVCPGDDGGVTAAAAARSEKDLTNGMIAKNQTAKIPFFCGSIRLL